MSSNTGSKEQEILQRQRQLAARMNPTGVTGNNNNRTNDTTIVKNTTTQPKPFTSLSQLKAPPGVQSQQQPGFHRSISTATTGSTAPTGNVVDDKTQTKIAPTNSNNVSQSSSTSSSNKNEKVVISMTGKRKVIDVSKQNHLSKSLSKSNQLKTGVPTKKSSSETTIPSSSSTKSSTSTIKRPTLKRPATKVRSTASLIAAARAKAVSTNNNNNKGENDISGTDRINEKQRLDISDTTNQQITSTTGAQSQKDNNILQSSPKLKRKKIDPTALVVPKSSTLANLVARQQQSLEAKDDFDEYDEGSPSLSPDDFWKNMREWDVVSEYNIQCRAQIQQQKQIQQQRQQEYQNNKRTNSFEEEQQDNDDNKKKSTDTNVNNNPNIPSGRKPLPDTFRSARHYIAAWAPLCLAECRAQLLQELVQNVPKPVLCSVESTLKNPGGRKGGRNHQRQNDFGGSDPTWLEENETGCHIILHPKDSFVPHEYTNFVSNDLFLLVNTQYKDVLQQITQNNAPMTVNGRSIDDWNAYSGVSLVGHTESSRRELNGLILKVSRRKWTTTGKSDMYLYRIGSNITALREFTALCGVDTLPMKSFLLGRQFDSKKRLQSDRSENKTNQPTLSSKLPASELLQLLGGSEKLGNGFLDYAKKKFNTSQLTAIAASAHEYGEGGFTLIKGPPGTGSK
jgi:hypothetical protein